MLIMILHLDLEETDSAICCSRQPGKHSVVIEIKHKSLSLGVTWR